MTASTKALFRATKRKEDGTSLPFGDLPTAARDAVREADDFYPTPPEPTRALLAAEAGFISAHGAVIWEPAAGDGAMAHDIKAAGFDVVMSDLVDRRGRCDVEIRDYFAFERAPAPVQITNPPYNQISARDGHGRWLRHAFDLGLDYVALLLNADWSFAFQNGHDALLRDHPPSMEYKLCWKVDFTGKGSPPQRNCWFVWDRNRPGAADGSWPCARLLRDAPDARQGAMALGGV